MNNTEPARPAGGAITQRELARLAGVSMTTIYNVLHQPELVNKKRLASIRKLMQEYDYHPDALAQAMVRGKSHIIGIVVPRLDIPYYAQVVCRIENEISSRGYKCLVAQHNDEPEKALEAVNMFRQYRADGVILRLCSQKSDPELLRRALAKRIPFVLLDETVAGFEAYTIAPDDLTDGERAAAYLVARGCRRFGFLGWFRAGSNELGPRFEGFRKGLEGYGIALDPALIRHCPTEYTSGREEVKDLWQANAGAPPDAILCFNDNAAINAYWGLMELGVKVPEEVLMLEFGGSLTPELLLNRSIVSMQHDVDRIAATACRVLTDSMEQQLPPAGPYLIPSRDPAETGSGRLRGRGR